MSSPDRPRFSQADFLARWMPSSARAGVILSPCPDLAGTLRHASAAGSEAPGPDDSFASDFAPLAGSVDSSCLGVDGGTRLPGGERAAADRPVNDQSSEPRTISDGELESLDEMESDSQEVPLMMKLEQLRKWQQHMQEQLKASQLEELLRLQEEQQRLLGMINGSQDGTKDQWDAGEDDQEQSVDAEHFHEHDDTSITSNGVALIEDNNRRTDKAYNDRPIGGQKKTFEELLEEQLRLEEQRLKSVRQEENQNEPKSVQVPPKKAFLKRGEGLARFTNGRKASLPKTEERKDCRSQPQARVITRSNSEPAAIQRGSTNGPQRLPVQRKTAKLNKENRHKGLSSPPQGISAESKVAQTKVLGCHQRQNTEGPESFQTEPTKPHQLGHGKEQKNRKVGLSYQATLNPGHSMQPVNKQGNMAGAPHKTENPAAIETNCGPTVGSAEGRPAARGGEVPQDSFELSFQEKLQRWERDRQLENMELGEFELLEQAADELSFSSNSSFVMKVLQMDRLNAARGLKPRRLSSTPIKSPPRNARVRCTSLGGSGFVEHKGSSMNTNSAMVREDVLVNKVRLEDKEEEDSGREEEHRDSDASSCGVSDLEDQDVVINPSLFPSTLCFPGQPYQPYDKRSYQDPCRDTASDGTQNEDAESDSESVLSNAESTLTEGKGGQQDRVMFDDDETWNDMEDTLIGTSGDSGGAFQASANKTSPPERKLYRKVAVSRAAEVDTDVITRPANQEPDPPLTPPSQLMVKLFPSLKPKAQNAPLALPPPPPPAAPESKKPEVETGQPDQSRLLRERLAELEIEIERFKKENAALAKLRQESERNQEILRKERLEFEQMKAEELTKFEEYKKEQSSKLQKERKLFEKHLSAARAIPDKKEREEIQVLKQQLSSLQEELRGKESRWASTHSRLRQQIDSLRQENTSLKDEVRTLEKLRLSAWRKTPVNAVKEMKDSPSIPESSVPSVTKGVKFASPLDSRGSSSSPPQSSTARRNSREGGQCTSAGIKSSLRKPAGPASSSSSSSSSSWPGQRSEERSTTASMSHDKPANQESSQSSSPKSDCPPTESECSEAEEPESAQESIIHPDGKVEKVLAGGDRLIVFPNGTRKEVSADGQTVKVTFFNGDTKEITADQRVIYYYAEAQTTHITYPDGLEVLHFPNNQTEKHFPDGRKEITFPDQTVKNLFPDGREESVLTDGTIIQVSPDGTKEIHFNTGQKEIHTAEYKRREYPDGTVKTVYADGRQETRYPTGRLRIKDKDGNIVMDNRL